MNSEPAKQKRFMNGTNLFRFGAILGVAFLTTTTNAQGPLSEKPADQAVKPIPKLVGTPQAPSSGAANATPPPSPVVLVEHLNGVVFVSSYNEIRTTGMEPMSGVLVVNIPLLQGPEFKKVIEPYLDHPFSMAKFHNEIARDIVLYCRKKNHPIVQVIMPEQEIKNGVLQLWFIEGKVEKVKISHTGKQWLSDQPVEKQVQDIRPDQPVNSLKLNNDLEWLNRHPFRQVDAQFSPGQKFGGTDVNLLVQDRLPFRPYIGYENNGTPKIGDNRVVGGFNFANTVGGIDQILGYQYSNDIRFDTGVHAADYTFYLPWRHILTFNGSYSKFHDTQDILGADGESYGFGTRYTIPLSPWMGIRQEVSVGFDWNSSNENLEFGGSTVSKTDVNIDQIVFGYAALRPDPWGQFGFSMEGHRSLGGNTANYQVLRLGTDADFWYGRAQLERITMLPKQFSWSVKATGQVASGRLLPSEELGFGGDALRGYYDRTASGDEGWIVSNEIRTPPLSLLKMCGHKPDDQLQFLAFVDYGEATIIDPIPNIDLGGHQLLGSVGGGFRYNWRKNLSIKFDYGYPLVQIGGGQEASIGHISVILSY